MKKCLFGFLCLLFSLSAFSQFHNKFNPYVNDSECHWLRKQKIDLFQKPILNNNFQKSVRLSLDLYEKENRAKSEMGALIALGLIGIGASFSNVSNSFTSQGINSILGSLGVISSSIAVKKYVDVRKFKKQKKKQLDNTLLLYTNLNNH